MQELQARLLSEFEQVKDRLRKANEYFETGYAADTTENQKKAEERRERLQGHFDDLWGQMGKVLFFDERKTVEEIWSEIEKHKMDFLHPVKVDCYAVSGYMKVRLEPPAFWRELVTRVSDE